MWASNSEALRRGVVSARCLAFVIMVSSEAGWLSGKREGSGPPDMGQAQKRELVPFVAARPWGIIPRLPRGWQLGSSLPLTPADDVDGAQVLVA